MRWYADTPARRSRQVLADLAVLAWVVLWVVVGRWVHTVVSHLAAPADPLRRAGTSMEERMGDVATAATDLPLVGGALSGPFRGAAGVGTDLVSAGDRLDQAVGAVALAMSLLTAGTPVLLVLGAHLLLRLRWSRRVSALGETGSAHALELLALRALVHQPPAALQRLAPDPVASWREGDPDTVSALAALELRRLGLRPRPGGTEAA